MTVHPSEQIYSAEAFEAFAARPENRDRHFELIDGAIVEKAMPTDEHALIAGLLITYLNLYALEKGIGLAGPEHRFQPPGDPHNIRQPDVSLIIDPAHPITIQGATRRAPDVIAEIRSPDESILDLRAKAQDYRKAGVRLIWLVFPRQRLVEVYRADQDVDILTVDDHLDGHDVLPGFSLPVARLFNPTRGG